MADSENPAANGEHQEMKSDDHANGTSVQDSDLKKDEQTNGTQKQDETPTKKEEPKDAREDWEKADNVYAFTAKDIDGKEVSLSKYKGFPTIIVNVATNCGFTKKNYRELNELFNKFQKDGLRIVAFPCNQFVNQEPGCEADIKEFAKKNGVKFDMMSKIDVNGTTAHPLYKWLKTKQRGVLGTTSIKWNFTKFLIDREGKAIKRYSPTTSPLSIEPDLVPLFG